MKIHKKGYKRAIATLLCAAMCIIELSHLPVGADCAYAATTTRLRLATAKSLAVANSEKIESIEMQIDAKKAAQTSAIQSLRERERSMSTFRWSPLLNFKFPSTPNEAEAFEFQFKPTQLEYNVKTLEHKLTDQKLSEYESVSTTYIDIITSTAEITFLEQRIKTLSATVLKNQARVTAGLATEEQVKQQQKTLDGLKNELASEKKTLLRAKEKMGKLIGFSVTSGYTFDDEFISTSMDAETVESLAAYAIDKDQTVYEAEQEMKLNDLALEINYNLMSSKYGGNMKMISGYIEQIQNGSSVNKRAFKKDYDAFLKKIDEPWTGSWKILFFSFPKEWLKGDLDGVRYIEDDPYVLYSAALDYQASVKEYEDAVISFLDPENKLIKYRLYRNNCIRFNDSFAVKDLRIFKGVDLKNVILLDNSMYSFAAQLKNGVLINSFYYDKNDTELYNVLGYLINFILPAEDIREVNEHFFNFQQITNDLINVNNF